MDRHRYAKYEDNLYDYDKVRFSLKYIKDKDVLDIGSANSGYPYVFDWLRKHAKSAIGIDNDARNVQILRKIGYDIRLGDAETFDLKKKFEIITFFDLI